MIVVVSMSISSKSATEDQVKKLSAGLFLAERVACLKPCVDTRRRRMAHCETGSQEIAAGRCLPVDHLSGNKNTGQLRQHIVLVDFKPANTACRRYHFVQWA